MLKIVKSGEGQSPATEDSKRKKEKSKKKKITTSTPKSKSKSKDKDKEKDKKNSKVEKKPSKFAEFELVVSKASRRKASFLGVIFINCIITLSQ